MMMYTYTRRNHSVEDYPHLERNSKHPDLTTEFTIHSCISLSGFGTAMNPKYSTETNKQKSIETQDTNKSCHKQKWSSISGDHQIMRRADEKKHRKTKISIIP
jgi:hypothetical protein